MKKQAKTPSKLGLRVRSALERAIEMKFVDSEADASRRAGLAKGYVSGLINGHKGDDASASNMARLSMVLRCDTVWLATGDGEMVATSSPRGPTERYPRRAVAVAVARDRGVPEQVVKIVESMRLDADEDPPIDWWLSQIELAKKPRRGRPPTKAEKRSI